MRSDNVSRPFAPDRPLSRRRVLRFGGAAALLIGATPLLAACGGSAASGTGAGGKNFGEIAIQLSWIKNIEFAGEYFADQKGYYTAAGFSRVTLTAGGAGAGSAESSVASGKAFLGFGSTKVTAGAITQGADLKTVGTVFQKNPLCILSLATNPVPDVQSMQGKKIGVQPGGNAAAFAGLLTANNIDHAAITTIPVQYDPTVLTTGQVDGYMGFITNEPLLIEAKGFKTTTFLLADYGLPLLSETFVVSQDTIDNDRDKLKALLVAEIKGWTDAVADPAQAVTYAVSNYGKDQNLEPDEQRKEATLQSGLIATAEAVANGLFTISDALVAANIKALGETGVTVTADQLFDRSVLKEVYSENPTLLPAFAAAAASVTAKPPS
jgi:ABC-type nitrate/sulfonate/bicarbonate transport system substrate-binding protein